MSNVNAIANAGAIYDQFTGVKHKAKTKTQSHRSKDKD